MHSRLKLCFLGRATIPVILQSEAAECGLACLAMVAGYHGFETDLPDLRRRWSLTLKGVTLAQLIEISKSLKLAPRALRLEMEHLCQLKRPAILHWDLDHFVVLERFGRQDVTIVDPAIGRRRLSLAEVSKHFTGIALELSPTKEFKRRKRATPLPLSAFFYGITGLGGALVKVLALSIALQLFLLVAPFFGQIVVDEIVVSNDRNLLTVLGIAFLVIVGIQVCISGIRGWLIVTLAATLQFGWGAKLFHHLIRLPLTYFERRHMGDIVSRFHSLRAVESLVANTVVEAIVDGLMAMTVLVVMFFYSAMLAGVVVAAVALYAVIRLLIFRSLRLATHEALVLGAKAESLFMESVRAIMPLKNYGREAFREAVWQNKKADALNAEIRTSKLELIQQLANTGIFAAENVAVLWIGAIAILAGDLSVGMLVAFISYKNQFGSRAAALVDKTLEFRLIDVHLDRLADIALADRDRGTDTEEAPLPGEFAYVEGRDLWFRYAETDPFVIRALNIRIKAGECVAVTGPSGLGKTTLIKLMMGLIEPTSGTLAVDDIDLRQESLGSYRRSIAAVMQDDVLLSGTLAENIAFFDPHPDMKWLEACAQVAAIHDEIVRMPMGYLTPVGDMGSALSGGQRQRIFLARALYSKPRILFLDEATSHLDAFTEHRVHQALEAMQITRVVVAHRRETLAIADRVVQLRSLETPNRQPHVAS